MHVRACANCWLAKPAPRGLGAHLVPAVRVHVHRREEAGLRGVRVDPAQRVEPTRVLRLEDLLLPQRLHRVAGALLLGHDERGHRKHRVVGGQRARQDAARLDAAARG